MVLGALLDLGVDLDRLSGELQKLDIAGYELQLERVSRRTVSANRFRVILNGVEADTVPDHHQHTPARPLREILRLIDESRLAPAVKDLSTRIFRRLGEAEARVHGGPPDDVHLHEVGAVDAIVDICGTAIALAELGFPACSAGPIHVGHGFVRTAHGLFPIPAPATAYLLEGVPTYATHLEGELITPTGAAILTAICPEFGPQPPMRILRTGHGAGKHDREIPNVLRVFLGEREAGIGAVQGQAVLLETNIDDMNPQFFAHLFERLLEAGALDVWLTPVHMKKGRPGSVLSVLSGAAESSALAEIVFMETTTIGIRRTTVDRLMLPRQWRTVQTPYGPIRLKEARLGDRVVNVLPEYEDCRAAARAQGVPLKQVWLAALGGVGGGE
jgi:hypothetical protein